MFSPLSKRGASLSISSDHCGCCHVNSRLEGKGGCQESRKLRGTRRVWLYRHGEEQMGPRDVFGGKMKRD